MTDPLKSLRTKRGIIWILIVVALLAFCAGYFAISANSYKRDLALNEATFASSTAASQSVIIAVRAKLAESTRQNNELSSELTYEQKAHYDLLEQKAVSDKEIDSLTKLTTIDPELLKKYSKVYFLSENYVPAKLDDVASSSLIYPNRETQFLDSAMPFLTSMLADANSAGVPLRVLSAYRSFGTQSALKARYKVTYGAGTANSFSADQGYSEHQLGTAADFATPDVPSADLTFEGTTAFAWLEANAYKYGFVISYPKSNTYYEYEPWHWRFVGRKLATELHDRGIDFYQMDQREIDGYLIFLFDN